MDPTTSNTPVKQSTMRPRALHRKATFSSRMAQLNRVADPSVDAECDAYVLQQQRTAAAVLDASRDAVASRRHHKENLREFIARKREMFLVQMTLDNKRAEIRKLEEQAAQRAAALDSNERALQEDAERFAAFLKENDAKVQEALKRAENEARARAEKVAELKRLEGALVSLASDMHKLEEQLEECNRYRAFVLSITPKEWLDQRITQRHAANDALQQAWVATCEQQKQQRVEAARALEAAQVAYEEAMTQQQADRARLDIAAAQHAVAQADALQPPPPPELLPAYDPDEAMYLTNPQQLIDMCAQLEASNLFMLQANQASQEAAMAAQRTCDDVEAAAAAQLGTLQQQVDMLRGALEQEQAKLAHMVSVDDAAHAHDEPEMHEAVLEAYRCCGGGAAQASTLDMLATIEARLEHCMAACAGLPRDVVEAEERARQAQRRAAAREATLLQQRTEQERRVQRVLQRAEEQPRTRAKTKPKMVRSVLVRSNGAAHARKPGDAGSHGVGATASRVEEYLTGPILL